MFPIETDVYVAILTVVGTVLVAYFGFHQSKQQRRLDSNDHFIDQLQEQLKSVTDRNDKLETRMHDAIEEIGQLRVKYTVLEIGVATLTAQIRSLGEVPNWNPPISSAQYEGDQE